MKICAYKFRVEYRVRTAPQIANSFFIVINELLIFTLSYREGGFALDYGNRVVLRSALPSRIIDIVPFYIVH